jgi:hypothetical protein
VDFAVGGLRELETDLALLLAEEDVDAIGAAVEPGRVAVAGEAGHHGYGFISSGRCPRGKWTVRKNEPASRHKDDRGGLHRHTTPVGILAAPEMS